MITLLLILNSIAALWGGVSLFRKTRNYAVFVFEIVFVMFFVVRPAAVVYFQLLSFDLKRYGVDNSDIATYLLSGFVFISLFHWIVPKLYRRRRLFSDRFFLVCDFDRVNVRRLLIVALFFAAATYLANVFKFGSLTYFLQNIDSFAADVSLEGGHWYVQILSWVILFPIVAMLGKAAKREPAKLLAALVAAMIVYNILAKPSTRTETIALFVAVIVYAFSVEKLKFNVWTIGISTGCVLLLLVFLNGVRQGNISAGAASFAIVPVLSAALQNVGPADNGMILVDYLRHHSWLYFRYLVPSLLPTSIIPGAIFPLKPNIDIEGALTYTLFGFKLDPQQYHAGGTLTFTVPIAGYADLGLLGTAVAAVLFAFLFAMLLRGWRSPSTSARFMTLFYLIFISAGFRLSVESLMATVYWLVAATASLHFFSTFALFRSRMSDAAARNLSGSAGTTAAG